ncbi:helix-turn-helix transcriptional regulator [Pseudomonas putida]|uniref:helix-turn-helix transcriptional regulator n=1 Tax=Pseudomonas putida TaxID=303 RepID=UPI003F7AD393
MHITLGVSEMSNPKSTLQTPPVLIPWEEGKRLVGASSDTTMYKYIAMGFPGPLMVGPPRANGASGKRMFVKAEVDAWLADRIAERDAVYGRVQPA